MKFPRIRTSGLMLAATAFLWSCGDVGQSPVSSVDTAVAPSEIAAVTQEAPAGTFVFSGRALRAAKHGVEEGTFVYDCDAGMIDEDRGGKLKAKFKNYVGKDQIQVISAEFKVGKKSLVPVLPAFKGKHLVTMSVRSGTSLDDVLIKFWPPGMLFTPAAELSVHFKGEFDGVAPVAYHVTKDGKVTVIKVTIEQKKGSFVLKVEVPGFSEYSYDDGDEEADEDPTHDDGSCWGC